MHKLVSAVVVYFACLTIFAAPCLATGENDIKAGLGKVLVIYYSYTGITEKVALQIAVRTDADVYQIEMTDPYDAENLRAEVKTQREQGLMPALNAPAPDISGYDLILVGNPVWMGDVPPPMVALLNQIPFNGRRLAFFCTSGPRPREYMNKFKDYAVNATIMDGINFGELSQDDDVLKAAVDAWLAKLGTIL